MKTLLVILSVLLFAHQANAGCAKKHVSIGWEPIWEGVTTIEVCGRDMKPFEFGYPLQCMRGFEPNYTGHAVLLERITEYSERYVFFWKLCLTEHEHFSSGLSVNVLSKPRAVEKE